MKVKPLVGILHGKETEFSDSLIARINEKKADHIHAELIKIGDIQLDCRCPYQLIVDRISYKVPYYASFLKTALLSGTYLINDPFWFDTSDHFFNFGLVSRLGIAVPRTVCLPSHSYDPQVVNADLGNMIFPLDWDKVIDYIGLPALMKPYDDLGWQNEVIIRTKDEMLHHYNQSGTAIMILQEMIEYERFIRCFVIGKKHVLPMPYDPAKHEFLKSDVKLEPELKLLLQSKSIQICQVLGYDMNAVDFAISKKETYAIDFMNPVPAVDSKRIGQQHFDWVVEHMSEIIIDYVKRKLSSYDSHHWYHEAKLPKRPRRRSAKNK